MCIQTFRPFCVSLNTTKTQHTAKFCLIKQLLTCNLDQEQNQTAYRGTSHNRSFEIKIVCKNTLEYV